MDFNVEVEHMHAVRPLSFENGANLRLEEFQLTRIDRPGAIDCNGDLTRAVRPDTAPSLVFLMAMTLAPETPRFPVLKGRIKEAFRVLERISGPEEAHREIADIQTTMHLAGIDTMQPKGSPWGAMLRPGVRRELLISVCLAVLIHISGINTVIDYAPAIFESAGWHTDSALASTMVIGVTQFLFSLVSFWAIDRYGRKPLYIIGSIGMSFSVASLAIAAVLGRFHATLCCC